MELQQLQVYGKSVEWRELMEWLTVLIQAFVEILVVTSNAMRPPSKQLSWKTELQNLQDLALENEIGACEMDEYGHFIGCIEKPTPMSAADLQMLGLPTYNRRTEAELIWAIEEQLGPCKTWKKYMAKLFWQAKMTNQDMMKVVTFCIGNGLDTRLLREWLDGRGVRYDPHKMNCDLNEAISWAKNDDPANCPYIMI